MADRGEKGGVEPVGREPGQNPPTTTERGSTPADRWLWPAIVLLIIVAPSQFSYALHPKHGPFILYADVLAGALFVWWAITVLAQGRLGQHRAGRRPADRRGRLSYDTADKGGLSDDMMESGKNARPTGPAAADRRSHFAPCGASRDKGRLAHDLILPPTAIWALLGVAVLSAAGATSLKSAAVEITQLALYFVAVFSMFVNTLRSQHRLGVAVKALGFATTIVVAWGLYHYFTQDDPVRVQGPFGNRNVYSGFLTMVLPLFFGMALWMDSPNQRGWFFGLVALGAFTMLAGPQFWCLAVVLLIVSIARSWATAGYFLVAAIVFLGATLTLAPKNYQALVSEVADPLEREEVFKIVTMPGEEPAPLVKKRWLEWQPALNMLGENFVLGVGVGNYQMNIGQPLYYGFLPNAKKGEPDTNNLYLVIAATTGFVGLACFVAFLGYFLNAARGLWMKFSDKWGQGLAAGLTGCIYAIILVNLFSSLFVRGNSLIWALLMAMITAVASREWRVASNGND